MTGEVKRVVNRERRLGGTPVVPPRRAVPSQLHSGIGVAGAIIGAVVAAMSVPAHVDTPSQIRLPALVLALGLAAPSIRGAFSSPGALLHPVNVLAAAPIYWLLLDAMQGVGAYSSVRSSDIRLAFVAIGLFSGSVWLSSRARPWRLPSLVKQAATVSLSPKSLFAIGIVAFTLAFQRFAIPAGYDFGKMLDAFGGGRWAVPWARGALGGWGAFLDHIGYFGYVLPPITAVLVRKLGLFHWRTLVMLALSSVLVALCSTDGGRRIIGVMAGSGMVVWFLSAQPPRLKDAAVMAICCAVLLGSMQLMLKYRGVGLDKAFSEDPEGGAEEVEMEHLAVDDNLLRLCQIIYIMPERHPHVGARWLVWVLVRPVPRVLWPGKPMDPGFDLPSYQGMQGVSLTMSLIGELYMAWGFVGCILGGLVLGKVAQTLAQVMRAGPEPGALITFGCGLLALFAGVRSGIELVLMSYGVLVWVALAHVYEFSRRGSPR
jgi:hypothetical protein